MEAPDLDAIVEQEATLLEHAHLIIIRHRFQQARPAYEWIWMHSEILVQQQPAANEGQHRT